MKIEVGDLVRNRVSGLHGVVTEIDEIRGHVYASGWRMSAQEARDIAGSEIPEWLYLGQCFVVQKANAARAPWTTTGTCTCSSRDLFAHGCKCGAIVRYADRAAV